MVALKGGWYVQSTAAFHLECRTMQALREVSELNSAFRNWGDQSWAFPRVGHVSSIKPDCPASGMGKAKSSGANLLPLHPPVFATNDAVRCECDIPYHRWPSKSKIFTESLCGRLGAESSGFEAHALAANYFFLCFMRRCLVKQDNNFKNWIPLVNTAVLSPPSLFHGSEEAQHKGRL